MHKLFWLYVMALFPLLAQGEWTLRAGLLFDSPEDLSGSTSAIAKTALESGIGYNVALGYDLPIFRVEAEAVFLNNEVGAIEGDFGAASGDFDRTTLFANAYLDIPLIPLIDFYVGGGVGVARASLDFSAEDETGILDAIGFADSTTVLGAQVLLGVRLELADRFHASLGYRYYIFQDTTIRSGGISLDTGSGEQAFDLSIGIGF